MGIRRKHTSEFKAKVGIEAIREQKTVNELSGVYGVNAVQIGRWKKTILAEAPDLFASKRGRLKDEEELKENLYCQIGQLKVELDWLKKKSGLDC